MPRLPDVELSQFLRETTFEPSDSPKPDITPLPQGMQGTFGEAFSGIKNVLEKAVDAIELSVDKATQSDADIVDTVEDAEVYEAEAVIEAEDAYDAYDDVQDV